MKYILTCLVFLGFAELGQAQKILTFEDAIARAMDVNYQIEIAQNNAAIARNNEHIGNAGLLPKFDISGATNSQGVTPAGGPEDVTTTTSAQLQGSYTLFDGFGNIYRFKNLSLQKDIGEADARNLIETTLFSVSQAYFSAASSLENLRIAQELLAISRERLERARRRSAFGQAKTVDVLAAEVDFNADSVTVTRAQLVWDEARRDLNVLLNYDVAHEFTVESDILFQDISSQHILLESALQNNASFQSQRLATLQSQFQLKLTRAFQLPRLDLNASYGYNQTSPDFKLGLNDPNESWRIGASINVNLFDGFQTTIERQNAKLNVKNQKLREQQARLELERALVNAYEAYQNSRLVLQLEQENLAAAETNFTRTQELFDLGQVTTTQFREAQLNLIAAKSNISQAKYSSKLQEIYLLRLAGQLLQTI